MTAAIEIVKYKDEYKGSCIDLLEQVFQGKSNRKTFEWRFESTTKNKPVIVCAKDQDRIVSFNSWLPWEFSYEGKLYIGYQSGDAATDKNYRRQGLRGRILEEGDKILKKRQIDFVFGFPNRKSYGSCCKAGHVPIGVFNHYVRLLNPFKHKRHESDQFDIGSIDSYFTLIDNHKITPVCDRNYVLWRYKENPKNYDFICFRKDNNKALFVVTENRFDSRKYRLKFDEVVLLDCQFSSFNPFFVKNAIQYLSEAYSAKARWIRTFFNPRSDRGKALKELFHFKLKPRYTTMMFEPINREINYSPFFNFHNWDIMPHVRDAS